VSGRKNGVCGNGNPFATEGSTRHVGILTKMANRGKGNGKLWEGGKLPKLEPLAGGEIGTRGRWNKKKRAKKKGSYQ